MKDRIVVDGLERLTSSDAFQARKRALGDSIRAKYAEELARAGLLGRWLLRRRISSEYRREVKKMLPSSRALFLGTKRGRGR